MSLLLLCLLLVVSLCVYVSGHSALGPTALDSIDCDNFPPFQSYHIHVLYWPNNTNSTSAAMVLRDQFIESFNVKEVCSEEGVSPADPAPQQDEICSFSIDDHPAGPFLTAQYSFFFPAKESKSKGQGSFDDAVQFFLQRRGNLDVFIHPNSGCTTMDHAHWSVWGGNKWELDVSVLHS